MNENNTLDTNRVYGLDVFRAVAILFVLIGHSFQFAPIPANLAAFNQLAILGVELFFVLSGFLIGSIIIRLIDQNRFHSLADILVFWKRRWLRTLPLYFVVLIAFIRFGWQVKHGLLDYKLYYIFMQNFAYGIQGFFRVSWSLAVEEHFYLWFPLIFLAWNKTTKRKTLSVLLTALTLIIVAYAFRLSNPFFSDWDAYDSLIRRTVLSRLDAIMFGVLMAMVKSYWSRGFDWIRRITPITAVLFVIFCTWWLAGSPYILQSRAFQINLYTAQAICCAFLLPWFDGLQAIEGRGNFFVLTSKLSYSLYLVHLLVKLAVDNTLKYFGMYDQIYSNPLAIYPLYFSLFYFVSWITYSQIEKPFLQLRDKPINFRTVISAAWPSIFVCATLIFMY